MSALHSGCISIQARYKECRLLRVIIRDKARNSGDLVYLCDRLQVGFREYPLPAIQ